MANKKTKKSAAASSGRKASVYSEAEQSRRERNGIIYIALGILFGIYIFVASSGILGKWLSKFIFGMCGLFTYFLPFVLVGAGVLTIAGKRGSSTGSFGWIITAILSGLTIAVVATNPTYKGIQFTAYLKSAYETGATLRHGGGLLGAIFCYPLQQLGGNVLCYVATITLILVALLMLTRISIHDIGIRVNKKVHTAMERVREYDREREYEREKEREEREMEREHQRELERLREQEQRPMRVFTVDESSGNKKQGTKNTAVAEEPETDTAEPLPTRKRKRAEKDDLAAFNAFAATLPTADEIKQSTKGDTPRPVSATAAKQKELPYLSETDFKPRPVRELKKETANVPLNAAAYQPQRETAVTRDDAIWEDLVPSGDTLTGGTVLPQENRTATGNVFHAAGSIAGKAAQTAATSAAVTAGAAVASAVTVGGTVASTAAVSAVNTVLANSSAPAAQTAAEPAEEPFFDPADESPFDTEETETAGTADSEPSPEEALAALRQPPKATVRENATVHGESGKEVPGKAGAVAKDGAANGDEAPEILPEPEKYNPPDIELLDSPKSTSVTGQENPEQTGALLVKTLETFGISTKLLGWSVGPVITQYELQPAPGVRVSKITSLSNDIALALAATRVRIEAPIPNKSAVGIEIPNKTAITVVLRDIIESKEYEKSSSPITLALGRDTSGKVVTADLGKMPHMLIAGSTGSGKSVCINDLIVSMVYKSGPKDLRLILIDPKVVELSVYEGLPHLLIPVVTEPKKASGALRWAVNEMTLRYKKFSEVGARDLARYNALQTDPEQKIYKLVVIIDELADLMMVAPDEVEESICRIAQLGRAAGIHLIVATQRPSADIITGLIKANIPSRCAFAVSSGVDSRIILDTTGAEKLLGRGDMLFHPNGANSPIRVQGAYVSDEEVERVMAYFRESNQGPKFDENIVNDLSATAKEPNSGAEFGNGKQDDELLGKAVSVVLESGQASISMIQRRLRVGYARAARLVDMMEQKGYVSGFEGSKARKVLIKRAEFEEIFGDGTWFDDDEIKAAQAREEESL